MMVHRFRCFTALFLFLALTIAGGAKADVIVAGSDYLRTSPTTFFDFGPPIGVVPFTGNPTPFGPVAKYDTIVQRIVDVTIPNSGSLRVKGLSLMSTGPAFGFPVVYVTLDPNNLAQDRGTYSPNGTAAAGGTFTSGFEVFFYVCTAPGDKGVGCAPGAQLLATGNKWFKNIGATWLPTGSCIVVNVYPDPNANCHTGLLPSNVDFFPSNIMETVSAPPSSGFQPAWNPPPIPANMVCLPPGLPPGVCVPATGNAQHVANGASGCPIAPGFPISSFASNGPGSVIAQITSGCGIHDIMVQCINCNFNVMPPSFVCVPTPPPATASVIATKIDPTQAAHITMTITDCFGVSDIADPVVTTLKLNTGHVVSQTFQNIPKNEHFIDVTNGSPGLNHLSIRINGKQYESGNLRDNQTVHLDAKAFMNLPMNLITFVGDGAPGSFANIAVSDTAPASQSQSTKRAQDIGVWGPLIESLEVIR